MVKMLSKVNCWCLYSTLNVNFIPAILSSMISRSPDELGPVYSIDPSDEREPGEAFGEDLDKELKQGPVKTDIAEPLSPYELKSYQSEFYFISCLFSILF